MYGGKPVGARNRQADCESMPFHCCSCSVRNGMDVVLSIKCTRINGKPAQPGVNSGLDGENRGAEPCPLAALRSDTAIQSIQGRRSKTLLGSNRTHRFHSP